jgi:chemotaxis protein MotB
MLRPGSLTILLPIVLASTLSGCMMMRSTHEAQLADLGRAHAEEQAALQAEIALREQRAGELNAELQVRASEVQRLTADLARRGDDIGRLEQDLVTAGSRLAMLETSLDRSGVEYEQLQERLLALSQVEREIRERNRIYEDVLGQFRSLIDAGRLSVEIVRGRMVIQLPQDILFQSGSASLSAEGTRTLREVGEVVAGLDDRDFQVEGHTDNVPIATERFPSNWELSSARAMSVIRVLLDSGVSPGRVSGAGYGEFQPRASNDSPDGRRLNRRIEIVMLPNLDVIATTPLPQ